MIDAPPFVDWPGYGQIEQQPLRGMSDYSRGAGCLQNANYVTPDGHLLVVRHCRWQARYKGTTTKWKHSAAEAIADLSKSGKSL